MLGTFEDAEIQVLQDALTLQSDLWFGTVVGGSVPCTVIMTYHVIIAS